MQVSNNLARGGPMVTKLLVVVLLGVAPWGGIWLPSTTGLAMGLGLPASVGLSTAGQLGGVAAILGAFSKAERRPEVLHQLARVRTERVHYFLNRYGIFGIPLAVVVLGAYAVTAGLAVLGMNHRRILISVSASLALMAIGMAIGMYIVVALVPLG